MKKRILNYSVLWTYGNMEFIGRNRQHNKDMLRAQLWIHNGTIKKNHTTIEEVRLPQICDLSNLPENTIDGWVEDENEDYIVITPNGETITMEEYMETEDYHNKLEQQIEDFITNKKEKELIKLFKNR